jgi:putative endonuclease
MFSSGKDYENRAADLLAAKGLDLVARNFNRGPGEIDIVALDGQQLVFVEVRSRGNPRFNSAAGSVDARKQRRIIRTAQAFLQQEPRYANLPCRFDVVAFEPPQSGVGRRVRWIRGAFTA